MSKKIDCVTFFSENFMFEFRYNVLKDFIDTFVVCESVFDHRGNKKELNPSCWLLSKRPWVRRSP